MKNKLYAVVFTAAVVAVSTVNVFKAQKNVELSDVGIENVEALADDTENSQKYKYVFYKKPSDPGYGEVACVCVGENGSLPCCDNDSN